MNTNSDSTLAIKPWKITFTWNGQFRNYVKIHRQAEISSRYIRAFGKSIIKIQSTLAIKSWEITYSFNENIKEIIQNDLHLNLLK